MSELKAFDIVIAEEGYCEGIVKYRRAVYDKSEADYVIAEKDAEIAELKDKCQMHDFFWEGFGFAKRGFKNSIAVRETIDRLEAENEKLRGESCKLTDGCLRLKQCRKEKAHLADKLRHSNRKRCLAMARWCRESLRLMRTYEVTEDFWNLEPGQDAEYFCKKGDFYSKWRKRWLKIAEEPTWAKFLQLIHKEAK